MGETWVSVEYVKEHLKPGFRVSRENMNRVDAYHSKHYAIHRVEEITHPISHTRILERVARTEQKPFGKKQNGKIVKSSYEPYFNLEEVRDYLEE